MSSQPGTYMAPYRRPNEKISMSDRGSSGTIAEQIAGLVLNATGISIDAFLAPEEVKAFRAMRLSNGMLFGTLETLEHLRVEYGLHELIRTPMDKIIRYAAEQRMPTVIGEDSVLVMRFAGERVNQKIDEEGIHQGFCGYRDNPWISSDRVTDFEEQRKFPVRKRIDQKFKEPRYEFAS
ncbi:hypothetical protein HYV81_05090 [Candidatus Woesearchaeota archaeon]|nr:hypothetical protein [Candidatus Woesearchaeota archaeon]